MNKKREKYIDGMKGIACIGIFLFHFNVAFNFCMPVIIGNIIAYTPLKILLDDCMVYTFCFLSGYVLCNSKVESMKELAKKIVKRYLRFALPIFSAYLVVYLFGLLWGFQVTNIGNYIIDYGLANYYQKPFTIFTIFYEPFIKIWFSASSIITPLWMIRYILYGSIIVYLYNYLSIKFSRREKWILGIFLIVLILIDFKTWLTLSVFLGMVIHKIVEQMKNKQYTLIYWFLFIFSVIMLWFGHEVIYDAVTQFVHLPKVFNLNGHWRTIYCFMFVLSFGRIDLVNKFLSNKYVTGISSISFALFLLHFPLICTFSMNLFFRFYFSFTEDIGMYIVLLVITSIVLILLSYLFHQFVEKYINKLLKAI